MRALDGVDVMVLWCVLSPLPVAWRTLKRHIGPPDGDPKLITHPSVHWWIKRHATALRVEGMLSFEELNNPNH